MTQSADDTCQVLLYINDSYHFILIYATDSDGSEFNLEGKTESTDFV